MIAPQAAQAALYAPGATLDPACAPTDANCGVQSNTAVGTLGQVPYYAANGNVLAATSTMTILSNGNVGIGTTTPYSRLSVWGAGTGATSMFELTNSASTSLMTVLNNGNVGIGTTSPSVKLHFWENSTNGGSGIRLENANAVSIISAGHNYGALGQMGSNGYGITGWANAMVLEGTADGGLVLGGYVGPVNLQTNRINRMTVAAAGNVGIGTTTPTGLLNIAGVTPKFTITNTSGAVDGKHWFLGNASGDFSIGTTSDSLATNTTYLTVKGSTGNVGIGTTSPLTKLSIQGTAGANNVLNIASSTGASLLYVAANGNVGIGTTNPVTPLEVDKNDNTGLSLLKLYNPNTGNNSYTEMYLNNGVSSGNFGLSGSGNVTNGSVYDANFVYGIGTNAGVNIGATGGSGIVRFYTAGIAAANERMRITSTGNVGIGTSTPYSRLTIWGPDALAGTAAFTIANSASTTEFQVFDNGAATLAGTLTQNSDQRLKQDITPLDASSTLAAIKSLNPVSFIWRDPSQGSTTQLGFIAQEVQKVFPQLVSTTSATALTPGGTLGINYIGLISPLIEAVKELAGKVSGFAQSITTAVLNATTGNFSGQVNTPKLCLGSTCVTESQLKTLLQNNGQQSNFVTGATTNPITITDVPLPDITPDTASTTPVALGDTASSTPAISDEVASTTPAE